MSKTEVMLEARIGKRLARAARVVAALLVLTPGEPLRAAEGSQSASPPSDLSKAPANAGVPDNYKLNLLIRTTIVALNQANATGNYSVLRDLASPSFQLANSQAKLAEIFSALRRRNLDLSPILFFEPKLVRPPAVQPNGLLRLSGYFETAPEQVRFDMSFERSGTDWRLFGLAIEVAPPAPPAAASPPAPPSPSPAAKAPEGPAGTAAAKKGEPAATQETKAPPKKDRAAP